MRYAIIPFLLYLLLQIPVFFIGAVFVKKEEDYKFSSILRTYVIGQMSVFAIVEILAVPMILLRWKFDILYYSFIAIATLLFIIGFRKLVIKRKVKFPTVKSFFKSQTPISFIILVVSVLVILAQFSIYFIGQHLDEDDARWMAEANDAIEYGDMMTRNFSTGEYQGAFTVAKDVTSPLPMFWAILAKATHVRTAVMIHTVYASFALLVMYMIYYLIAKELFEKKDARYTFLLSVAVINMFYAQTVYTQSVFSMTRIWQGKATVAAITIPLFIYLFICINKRNELNDWLLLPIVSCGSCLLSGMGVSLSLFMIAVYGAYNIIAYKNIKRIPLLILSVAPAVILSLVYFFFKG